VPDNAINSFSKASTELLMATTHLTAAMKRTQEHYLYTELGG
jgi:hypothetical protein